MSSSGFEKLIGLLSGHKEGVLPSAQTFPPIDTEQLARELELEARGRQRVPLPGGQPDPIELEISDAVGRKVGRSLEDFRSQLDTYDHRIRQAHIIADHKTQILTAAENALADFKVQTIDESNRIHTMQEELTQHSLAYDEFKRKHSLTRPSLDITKGNRRFKIALLVLFLVIESILNGLFFSQGSELGIIGGVTEAFLLSCLNVGGAVVYGYFGYPFLTHKRVAVRGFGLLSTFIFVAWLLGLNLAIAHYRDLFVAANGSVDADAWVQALVSAPLNLHQVQSWILAALGVALGLASLVDVDKMRDRYPAYGAIGRRRRDALDAYARAANDTLALFQQTRNDATDGMGSVVKSIREAQFDLSLAITGRERLISNMKTYLGHASAIYEMLLARYRNIGGAQEESSPLSTQNPSWASVPIVDMPPAGVLDDMIGVITLIEDYVGKINRHYVLAAERIQSVRVLAGN